MQFIFDTMRLNPVFITILGVLYYVECGLAATLPNIIFIMTDDQGYADVGYHNPNCPIPTPNIDRLALNGVRLENYYVHPTCSPSRAALMTGRYATNVGISIAFTPASPGGVEPEYKMLPEELSELGYRNYLVGKWHLGQSKKQFHPLNRGFHSFYGLLGGGLNFFTKQVGFGRYDWWRNWEPEWDNKTHVTLLLNKEATNVVEKHVKTENEEVPFFLYLAHPAPHDPLLVPEQHLSACDHIQNHRRRLFCGLVHGVDVGIGELVDTLEKHNLMDNTIIVFSSDNGGKPYAGGFNYPFKGGKATAYEGGVRVPGFVHGPKKYFKNNNFDHNNLFHISDFYPTFMDIIARESKTEYIPNPKWDGVSQYNTLSDPQSKPVRRSIHIHRDVGADCTIYRRDNYKLIVGQHLIPFAYTEVFEEPTTWLKPTGGILESFLEIIFDSVDFLFGEGNTIFFKYGAGMIFEGELRSLFSEGSFKGSILSNRGPPSIAARNKVLVDFYNTDLKAWLESSDVGNNTKFPTVSLYDLENDPSEQVNLAYDNLDLVEELLKEADQLVEHAPPQFSGAVGDQNAPKGVDKGTLEHLLFGQGTFESTVIPFGPYLPDDADYDQLETINIVTTGRLTQLRIVIGLLALLILPRIIMLKIVRKIGSILY